MWRKREWQRVSTKGCIESSKACPRKDWNRRRTSHMQSDLWREVSEAERGRLREGAEDESRRGGMEERRRRRGKGGTLATVETLIATVHPHFLANTLIKKSVTINT